MPDPNALKRGDPVARNWVEFNALLNKVNAMERKLQRAAELIAKLESRREIWGAGGGMASWRGEWRQYEIQLPGEPLRFRHYAAGDMVIRGGEIVDDPERLGVITDGTIAGTWIAARSMTQGEAPGQPTAAEIATGVYDWTLVARFASPEVVARKGNRRSAIGATAADAALYIGGDDSGASITISLNAALGKTITLRQITVCQNNVKRKMIVLASEPFD